MSILFVFKFKVIAMTRKRTYLVISAQKWNWEKYMRF